MQYCMKFVEYTLYFVLLHINMRWKNSSFSLSRFSGNDSNIAIWIFDDRRSCGMLQFFAFRKDRTLGDMRIVFEWNEVAISTIEYSYEKRKLMWEYCYSADKN